MTSPCFGSRRRAPNDSRRMASVCVTDNEVSGRLRFSWNQFNRWEKGTSILRIIRKSSRLKNPDLSKSVEEEQT